MAHGEQRSFFSRHDIAALLLILFCCCIAFRLFHAAIYYYVFHDAAIFIIMLLMLPPFCAAIIIMRSAAMPRCHTIIDDYAASCFRHAAAIFLFRRASEYSSGEICCHVCHARVFLFIACHDIVFTACCRRLF